MQDVPIYKARFFWWAHDQTWFPSRPESSGGLHIRPHTPGDRMGFVESWNRVPARFVDDPRGAVMDADQQLDDVMSMRPTKGGFVKRRAGQHRRLAPGDDSLPAAF
jgi:hypothetical protein